MKNDPVIRSAEFNPKVKTYWLLSGIITCVVTIVGIPFLLVWVPLGLVMTGRWLKAMECTLTSRNLILKKGVLNRIEKTVPLEKITDMGMAQGPIMRSLDLHRLSVETAGQSGPGALVSVIGIKGAPDFRQAVLEQRDKIAGRDGGEGGGGGGAASRPSPSAPATADLAPILAEIRDTLKSIDSKMS